MTGFSELVRDAACGASSTKDMDPNPTRHRGLTAAVAAITNTVRDATQDVAGHSSIPGGPLIRYVELSILAAIMSALGSPVAAAEVWRYGTVEVKGDAGIMFMPTKFARNYDLDIRMVQFASSVTPVKALISGDIDVFTTTPGVPLMAMSQGAKIKFIGCNWPGAAYTLYAAAGVTGAADLAGQTIGSSGPGSLPDLFAREALSALGVRETSVTFVNAGGGTDRYRALLAGIVKATSTVSEFEPDAAKRGLIVLARAREVTPQFARLCLVTSDKVLQTRRAGLVKFLAALMDGTSYAVTHRTETLAYTREIAGSDGDGSGAAFLFDEAVRNNEVDPKLATPLASIQWIDDMLARHDLVDQRQDVAPFIDDGPRRDALTIRLK